MASYFLDLALSSVSAASPDGEVVGEPLNSHQRHRSMIVAPRLPVVRSRQLCCELKLSGGNRSSAVCDTSNSFWWLSGQTATEIGRIVPEEVVALASSSDTERPRIAALLCDAAPKSISWSLRSVWLTGSADEGDKPFTSDAHPLTVPSGAEAVSIFCVEGSDSHAVVGMLSGEQGFAGSSAVIALPQGDGGDTTSTAASSPPVTLVTVASYPACVLCLDSSGTNAVAGYADGHVIVIDPQSGAAIWTGDLSGPVSDAKLFLADPPSSDVARLVRQALGYGDGIPPHQQATADGAAPSRVLFLDAVGRVSVLNPLTKTCHQIVDKLVHPVPPKVTDDSIAVSNRSFNTPGSLPAISRRSHQTLAASVEVGQSSLLQPGSEGAANEPEVEQLGTTLAEGPVAALVTDVDADGRNEIVIATASGSLAVCALGRDDSHSPQVIRRRGLPFRPVALVSMLNEDGSPAIAVLGEAESVLWLPMTASTVASVCRSRTALNAVDT